MKVLVVDDHAGIRMACRGVLKSLCVPDEASCVADARSRMASTDYDAGIFDVILPDGSGIMLLKWARNSGRRFPVLVLTGSDDPSLSGDAFLLGARLVHKPVRARILTQFIEEVSERRLTLEEVVRAYAIEIGLAPRQETLVLLLARGVMRRGMAEALDVTDNTVKSMLRAILARTGLPSTEALLSAILARCAGAVPLTGGADASSSDATGESGARFRRAAAVAAELAIPVPRAVRPLA